jgi:putative oxidoreductase
MKIAMIIVRTLMGLLFLLASVTVLPGLLSGAPMPMPPDIPAGLKQYMDGLVATHYFLILLKVTELVCGLAFVSGYYVPLATVIIAPVIINIFFINLVFTPAGLVVALPLVLANCFVAYYYRAAYAPLLRPTL